MTPKQKIKYIEKKMDRISNGNPLIDFYIASKYFSDIKKYYELRQQYFILEFEINNSKL